MVVATLGTTQTLAWASTYYLPAVLADTIAADLNVSRDWFFGAFSASLLISAFLGPSVGRFIDRRGGRDVLALSNIVFALGLIVLAVSHGPAGLIIAWTAIGIGMALGLYEPAFSTLAGLYGSGARSAITGITLIAGFASTIGWPVSTFLSHEIGWRATCLIWAALHVLFGLPANRFLMPSAPPPTRAVPQQVAPAPDEDATRTLVLLAVMFGASAFVSGAMSAHLPRLLAACGITPDCGCCCCGPRRPCPGRGTDRRVQPAATHLATCIGPTRRCPPSGRRSSDCRAGAVGGNSVRHPARRGQRLGDDCPRHVAARTVWARRIWPTDRAARGARPGHAGHVADHFWHRARPRRTGRGAGFILGTQHSWIGCPDRGPLRGSRGRGDQTSRLADRSNRCSTVDEATRRDRRDWATRGPGSSAFWPWQNPGRYR